MTFLSNCDSEALRQRIMDEGFNFIPIEKPHPDPSDLNQTLNVLKRLAPCPMPHALWIVLDGYHFTPEYQKAIRDAGIRLLAIDDMNHLQHYHADIVVNQNIDAEHLHYACELDTRLLLGTKYALLRKEFRPWQGFKRKIPEVVRNVLVTLGGADPGNVTLKVIQAIKLLNNPNFEVKVVVGPSNPHAEELKNAVLSAPCPMHCIENTANMPELMEWADLAISASGSTCWELAFMGLPNLLVILAENQVELAEHLEAQQATVNIGWYNMFSNEQLCTKIDVLINDRSLRRSLSENESFLVDGKGTSRAANAMIANLITLRRVTHDDCNLIWKWSNEKEARQASFSQGLISWDEHVQWFKQKFADPNHVFFIATNGNKNPVGQIRYSVEGKKAIVSFSIAAESRNLGYGSEILRVAARKLFHETEVEEVLAFVKDENLVSLKTFQNAGFKKTEELFLHGTKSYKFVLIKQN